MAAWRRWKKPRALPPATVLSGPAGGVSGGRRCADLLGIADLVPFDMGGTSTDISLIADGQAPLSADGMLAGSASRCAASTLRASRPAAARLRSVDASGTLARRSGKRGLDAGPGAVTAMAALAATVTDANVVLGYLDAAAFMGGARPLDRGGVGSRGRPRRGLAGLVAAGGRRRHLPA